MSGIRFRPKRLTVGPTVTCQVPTIQSTNGPPSTQSASLPLLPKREGITDARYWTTACNKCVHTPCIATEGDGVTAVKQWKDNINKDLR